MQLEEFDDLFDLSPTEDNTLGGEEIAVVGLSVMAGHAHDATELWEALCRGENFVRAFPEERRADADAFARFLGIEPFDYAQQSYLDRVDQFCPSFFHIPPKDAALLDPAQRLFLQTAWRALEDAGLSKQRLSGSDTGIFVGYTAPEQQYSKLLAKSDPEYADRALSGTVNSIIASRLSYYLNLRGPAVMVDTACSSSLVAVHLACNALRAGDCSIALAGTVKFSLIPERAGDSSEITVNSRDGQTRTFDMDSDGTNGGEGVAALILKPLSLARRDRDRIYALIKGSAINQDGASVGITAPNAAAQEAVILKAWENAGIDPEQVSYIEAHGTATRLGDPIEISGIQGAFRKYTDRKQFCAIGSLKTNMGHLDCGAGLMGLVKCILSLRHKLLPPHLHFTSPNRRIDFVDSPVYINDRLQPWDSEGPRICGVSSFGMSGTNCHVVLQEGPEEEEDNALPMVLAISAADPSALRLLAESIEKHAPCDPKALSSYIFTANVSKSGETERFATVISSYEDLKDLGERVAKEAVSLSREEETEDLPTEGASPEELCRAYLSGKHMDWYEVYSAYALHITSHICQPLTQERIWLNPVTKAVPVNRGRKEALLDACLTDSPLVHVYTTAMSEDSHSEVREHMIGERNVLAGTVYVEMLRSAGSKMLGSQRLQIDSLVFMSPMIFDKGQTRQVQTVLYRKNDNELEATVQSRGTEEEEWSIHVKAKLSSFSEEAPDTVDVQALLSRMGENVLDKTTLVDQMVTTGPRWKVQRGIWTAEGEAVTYAAPEQEFAQELQQYGLYPSMLDAAVNCSSVLNGEIFCLPYYYGSMRIYGPMTGPIYSHTVKNRESSSPDGELHIFDIQIFDESGRILATVKDYGMKKAGSRQTQQFFQYREPLLRESTWISETTQYRPSELYSPDSSTLLVSCVDRAPKGIYQAVKNAWRDRAYELLLCSWPARNTERKTYIFPESQKDFTEFFREMEHKNLSRVLFFLPEERDYENGEDFRTETETLAQGFFHMISALASNKALGNLRVDIMIPVKEQPSPLSMLIAGMGKSILFEYSRLELRCILFSGDTESGEILEELSYNHSDYMILRKQKERFVPQIIPIDEEEGKPFHLRKGGSYLITGGTGGIGLVMAELLSEIESDIRLILLSRSQTLPPDRWETAQEPKYRSLCKLRNQVSALECASCDIADAKALAAFMDEHRQINGVIHAAGLPGGGFVIKRQWKDVMEVMSPKILGTGELVRYAEERDMDFLVLFSSYSAVLSVGGQADYIGANSFMDACADFRNPHGRIKVLNWSGWRECGMALANGVDMEKSPVRFLNNQEGKEAFLRAMSCKSSRVLIGQYQYKELASSMEDYEKLLRFDETTLAQIRKADAGKSRENENYTITVRGKDTPLSPTEEQVAQAWAKTLGLREVHYRDRFLEIGGDSLSATYLQKEIEKHFPGTMDITDVFVYPTIEQMSDFIDSKLGTEPVADEEELPPTASRDEPSEPATEEKLSDAEQMRRLLELLASGEIDVGQAGQLL